MHLVPSSKDVGIQCNMALQHEDLPAAMSTPSHDVFESEISADETSQDIMDTSTGTFYPSQESSPT